MRATVVQYLFDFICVSASLLLNGEVDVCNFSRMFLFPKVPLATIKNNWIFIYILSGYPAGYHLLSGRIAVYLKNRPGSRITEYEPDKWCYPTIYKQINATLESLLITNFIAPQGSGAHNRRRYR